MLLDALLLSASLVDVLSLLLVVEDSLPVCGFVVGPVIDDAVLDSEELPVDAASVLPSPLPESPPQPTMNAIAK